MAPKRTTRANPADTTTTTSMTNAQLRAMIDQGVTDALAARDANRNMNGDDIHNSGTGGNALTWWNSHVKTVGNDVTYAMTWTKLKKKMTDKYCPGTEIKKLEVKLWDLKVKGTDVIGYNQRFQELALLCVRMFPEESDKIERYVGCLPDMIHKSVVASKPKTMQEAIEITTKLMDKRIRTFTERQTKNKRKQDDNQQQQQQQNKRRNTGRAYTAGIGEKKPYGGLDAFQAPPHFHDYCAGGSYPADGGDDDDDEDESSDDDEDDDVDIEEDEEEEEHLAPADSIAVALPAVDQAPSAEETKPFKTDEFTATPAPHPAYRITARMSIRDDPPTPFWFEEERRIRCTIGTPPLLPIPLPTSSPPLHLLSTDHRADRPEVTLLPRKRLGITLGPRYEVRESSSAPTARPPGGFMADYGFVATMDMKIRRDLKRDVDYGITDTCDDMLVDMPGAPATDDTELDDEQTERHLMAGRLNMLYRDRRAHARITLLMERERLGCLERLEDDPWTLAADRRRQEAITELLAADHRRQHSSLRH
ncbi:reverse transcriptase domain-containing protein [Tanacetum coccineum]